MADDPNFGNLELLEELYDQFQHDPKSLDPSWNSLFNHLENHNTITLPKSPPSASDNAVRIDHLIRSYRKYGHLMAKIDPIATHPIEEPWQLKLDFLGFSQEDLNKEFPTCGLLQQQTAPLQQIIDTLRTIYCGGIGIEYMELDNPHIIRWLQANIEPNRFKVKLTIEQKKMILQQLNRSELLETFIHMKYTGQKRFSLEGGETLIPMLEAIIESGCQLGLEEFAIGMAHRGRLNVLSNIMNKSYSELFSEFEEGYIPNSFEGSGDVKYHKGFYSEVDTPDGRKARITLLPNPSHLEAVDPVVEGFVCAKQIKIDDTQKKKVLPILIHGDAAISGQGVVYETMQFIKLPGYSTGGTIHIVINNQVGFTAAPEETRSTRYCTDIAKAFAAPIFHVNAEDPEACVYVTNLALQLRQQFHCDVFIDLNCYRKYGHNESDEPAFTQPLEYQLIRKKPPIREIYRDQLVHEGVLEKELAGTLEKQFTDALQQAQKMSKESLQAPAKLVQSPKPAPAKVTPSIFSAQQLQKIAKQAFAIPDSFNIHPKLKSLLTERLGMSTGAKPIDWGMAEVMAYGTLLCDGVSVRISGQDCGRGTFSHRHLLWTDQKIEKTYSPLSHLKEVQGRFDIYNSSLSEYAVVGFELGYSVAMPEALVIWEAQFGDFSNGAQIMFDQFISSTEKKWGQTTGLTLFLPHGYEGQGPEHSSARIERYLILCAEDNMRVVYPTTPAQHYHLLRKQALNPVKKPLVVFTPKGLLRHPACISTLEDLEKGGFQEILDDANPPKSVRKLVFCSGRIYYDLIAEREKRQNNDVVFVRIEQLYPLNTELLKTFIDKYKGAKEFIWAQEEPQNMGPWSYIQTYLRDLLPGKDVHYVGRALCASPATGSYAMHKKQYAAIMDAIFAD